MSELTGRKALSHQRILAAASRAVPTSAPLAPGMGTSKDAAAKAEPIDIEKIANEIYRHIDFPDRSVRVLPATKINFVAPKLDTPEG